MADKEGKVVRLRSCVRGILRKHIAIRDCSVGRSLIISVASILEICLFQRICLRFQESSELTPPVTPFATTSEALSERYRALIQQELHVLRLLALILVRAGVSALRATTTSQWLGAVDEANVEDTSERLHVRYDKCAVLRGGLIGRYEFCELCKAERGQDCCDVGVMAEVENKDLCGWESGLHARECHYQDARLADGFLHQ